MITDQTQVRQQLLTILNDYAQHDKDFASDLKRKDKSVEMFMYLMMQKMMKDGAHGSTAVFGDNAVLIGQAIHYFHEDNVKLEDLFTDNMYLMEIKNPEAPKQTPSSATTKKAATPSNKKTTTALTKNATADDIDIDIDEIPDVDIDLD